MGSKSLSHGLKMVLAGSSCLSLVLGTAGAPAGAAEPNPPSAQPVTWPRAAQAPADAPNVIVVLTDDVGFGASSTFGGVIPTPALDALAQRGIRYNNFNTTAICSPTRASLLTGRYPHNVGMGQLVDTPANYEGYTSVIPKSAATVAQVLKDAGFNTAMFGKSHVTPLWEATRAGPFDRWPTGLGFEYFYGFMQGDTSQWTPALVENTTPVQSPAKGGEYILDRDLTDRAIHWMRHQHSVAPDKPFFMYFASGTAHAPNHAPPEWMAKFRGQFDLGWDRLRERIFERQKVLGIIPPDTELTPRDQSLPAWDSLPPSRQRVAARLMEAYAAQLAFFDAQMGRLLDSLRQSGQLDNTLIVFIEGDNGASGEGGIEGRIDEPSWINGSPPDDVDYAQSRIDDIGGPKTYNLIPAGWAWALNTPFKWFKQAASHFGGTRNGMVISWPRKIRSTGLIQSQFAHVADIAPTILEVVGVAPPAVVNGTKQKPLDGISLAYSFNNPSAPSRRRSLALEMMQNVAMYQDGWIAATKPLYMPWQLGGPQRTAGIDGRTWELYHVSRDFSEARDLATQRPEKLRELQALFAGEAAKNNILPIHPPGVSGGGRPHASGGRTEFTYFAGTSYVDRDAAPPILNRSFDIEATVDIAPTGASGVVVAHGGHSGGYSFYLKDGRLSFAYNAVQPRVSIVRSTGRVEPGKHTVGATFVSDGGRPGAGGTVTISVDGRPAGSGRIESTLARAIPHGEGLDVGADFGSPVSDDYAAPFLFPGEIEQVRINLK